MTTINKNLDRLKSPHNDHCSSAVASHSSPASSSLVQNRSFPDMSNRTPSSELILGSLIEPVSVQSASPTVNTCSKSSATSPPFEYNNFALPPLDIEVFAGDFVSWPTFRDLFTTLFVNNSRLSNIERLCHLRQKTIGEAREIVDRFPLTNCSFPLAWKALSDAYDNKRIVVNSHIKSLFDIPLLKFETCSGLKTIQRGVNSCLAAMAVYDVATDQWDPIIVHICLQRLPLTTLALWEQSIKNKSLLPSWSDLDAFLTNRIQTLQCIQIIHKNPPTERPLPKIVTSPIPSNKSLLSKNITLQRSAKKALSSKNVSPHCSPTRSLTSKHVHTSSSVIKKSLVHESKCVAPSPRPNTYCSICPNQSHVLRLCPKFIQLSFEDKFLIVKKNKRCINCFSRGHVVKHCRSTNSCKSCNQRHHSLLHRPQISRVVTDTLSKPSLVSTNFTKSHSSPSCMPSQALGLKSKKLPPAFTKVKSRGPSSPPAFTKIKSRDQNTSKTHPPSAKNSSSQYPNTIEDNVLMGTALVNIVHNGKSYTARAIVDPSSKASIVSKKLKNKLGILTQSETTCSKAAAPREVCSLQLSSPRNSSRIVKTKALVLPKIKGKLFSSPSFCNLKTRIPNLDLADSFDNSPIDLLLGADLYPKILEAEPPQIVLDSLLAQKSIFGYILTGSVPPATVT